MAEAQVLGIADAVVGVLNAATFDAPFNVTLGAQRVYKPVYRLQDLASLKVPVACRSAAGEVINRVKTREMTYEVDVGLLQRLPAPVDTADQPQVDALIRLAEQIADLLIQQTLTLTSVLAVPIGVAQDPLYDPAKLDEEGLFVAVVTVTYRAYR